MSISVEGGSVAIGGGEGGGGEGGGGDGGRSRSEVFNSSQVGWSLWGKCGVLMGNVGTLEAWEGEPCDASVGGGGGEERGGGGDRGCRLSRLA